MIQTQGSASGYEIILRALLRQPEWQGKCCQWTIRAELCFLPAGHMSTYHFHRSRGWVEEREARVKGRIRQLAYGRGDRITIKDLLDRDGHICGICSKPISPRARKRINRASIDHKIPISKGGTHTWDNVQAAHLGCNIVKGARL